MSIKRILIGTYLFSILTITLISVSCKNHEHKNHPETIYSVIHPLIKDTIINQDYVCQINAIQHIEIRAMEEGYLQNIYVDEGQRIKKGQVMFQIMPLEYQAEYKKAEAEVNYAKIEYLNTKSLADSNIVSTNELALSKAKLEKAEAELDLAQTHLNFTKIIAPFSGIMDRFKVRLGSLVEDGELLTSLSDNSDMWVYFNVPEAEYLDYVTKKQQENQVVKLLMANNKLFKSDGVIETIEADFNRETGNIAFRAKFPNTDGILRHGETGSILIPTKIENAVIIPQKSTFEILDQKYVFVVDENNEIHNRKIEIQYELPNIYLISKGLTKSDKVLVNGLRTVKNNDRIKYELANSEELISQLDLYAE